MLFFTINFFEYFSRIRLLEVGFSIFSTPIKDFLKVFYRKHLEGCKNYSVQQNGVIKLAEEKSPEYEA